MDNITNQGITFLVGLVLARLLSPHEYGLIGYIMIIVAILNSIVDSGFSNALIRKKDAVEIDYDTTFIFNLVLSFLMVALMYLCAPWVSSFLREPELIPLIRVMSVIIVINALAIIQRTTLIKRVDFKTQTKVSLIASVTSGVVGIGMALSGYGVWSLAGQQLCRQVVNTVFLWVFNKWTPKWQFSWNSFRELFNFGWKSNCQDSGQRIISDSTMRNDHGKSLLTRCANKSNEDSRSNPDRIKLQTKLFFMDFTY